MPTDPTHLAEQLKSLAALDEPVRRQLYLYVVKHGGNVSREEAAKATGVSRALAAFHLDKLVESNLLQSTFRRLSGRAGPGAGRPSKLYRRSNAQFDLSLPQRRYELAAHVLTRAMARSEPETAKESLRDAACDWGKQLASDLAVSKGRGRPLKQAVSVLEACGFEPQGPAVGGSEVLLRNCPFDSLRNESRELICGMNLALIEGIIDGLSLDSVHATLAPRAGMCCVALSDAKMTGRNPQRVHSRS
jgi:predicted ArsR family transcriptional regulator